MTNSSTSQLLALAGLHLLVVEDDIDNRDLLVFIFEEQGAYVTAVESAQQALEILEQFKPDAILCDLNLLETDGCHLLSQWREREVELGLLPVPAFALSGMVSEQAKQQASEAGFLLHIAKPFDVEKLPALIAAALNRSPGTQPVTEITSLQLEVSLLKQESKQVEQKLNEVQERLEDISKKVQNDSASE